jgi:seryl-tRNA synthetase
VSPLTKIFVMLLVVSSLLNAAAIVVFVNKEQITDQAYKELAGKNGALESDKDALNASYGAAHGQVLALQQLAAKDAADTKSALDKAAADLASKDADNKQLLRNSQAQDGNLQASAAQLSIALSTVKQDAQTINDLRDAISKAVQNQAESDAALARQRQLAETYGRQVEYLSEQIKKAQDTIKAYSSVITQNRLTLPTEPTAQSMSGPAVSGIVQDKQSVNGVTYLTISVGSTDSVQPGMQFRVVDTQSQPQEFLGILTITQADANSAIGRLQSDDQMVAKIRKGNEVTTEVQ